MSLCFLAEGRYEIGAGVREESNGGEEGEMRGFVAREPMVIDVDR